MSHWRLQELAVLIGVPLVAWAALVADVQSRRIGPLGPLGAATAPAAPSGGTPRPAPAPVAPVAVVARYSDGSGDVMLVDRWDLSSWRYDTPHRYATREQLHYALTRFAGIPEPRATVLVEAFVTCEAPFYLDGVAVGADLYLDNGVHVGAGQFNREIWKGLLAKHDVRTAEGVARIAAEIIREYERAGWAPLGAWECVKQ